MKTDDPRVLRAVSRPRPGCVLHVIQSAGLGGSESVFLALSRALHAAGWPLAFAIGEEGWLAERVRELGIPVHVVGGLGRGRAFEVRSVLALRRLILDSHCTLVHAMMFPAQFYAALAARLTGLPCIVSIRNSHYDLVGRKHRFIWRHMIAPLSPHIVTVTRSLADEARRVTGSDRVTCIYNGVDVDRFAADGGRRALRAELGIPESAIVIGSVGNLRPVKGHVDLVRAVSLVAAKHPEVRLLLIGAECEPTAGELRELGRELRLSERVLLLGRREDIPALLQAMDVFCLPSHSEGMSGALLQAMAVGLPVVATAVGGNPEVILDDTVGLLVPPRDPAAMSEALLKLVELPRARERMGRKGLARIQADFSLVAMVRQYTELYEQLVGRAPGTAEAVRQAG